MAGGAWLKERFGVAVRVVGAPMAGVAGGRLAGAISAAGGLGMIGVGPVTPPEWIEAQCAVAAAAGSPFGVGLMAWALEAKPEQLDATIAGGPAFVSVSFGDCARFVDRLAEAGIVTATQAGTVEQALAAQSDGFDVVVARGAEAGGHGLNQVGTLPLLQSVLDAVAIPVLAAGGISAASGVAAVLAAGAAGAWVGTAFLACPESESSEAAKARIVGAGGSDTAYGRVFDVAMGLGWPPEYGGRALRNDFFDRWEGREDGLAGDADALEGFRAAVRARDFDTAYLYAGQGIGMLDRERPAAEVVADLARADELLRAAAGL